MAGHQSQMIDAGPTTGDSANDGSPKPDQQRATSLVAINLGWLNVQRALRGWTWRDLMKVTGIGNSTMTAITSGRPVSAHVFRKIAITLAERPAVPGAERLIGDDDDATK